MGVGCTLHWMWCLKQKQRMCDLYSSWTNEKCFSLKDIKPGKEALALSHACTTEVNVIFHHVDSSRPSSTQLVSNTVELLVHSCSSQDRDIRFSASENLRKLIKVRVYLHDLPAE